MYIQQSFNVTNLREFKLVGFDYAISYMNEIRTKFKNNYQKEYEGKKIQKIINKYLRSIT